MAETITVKVPRFCKCDKEAVIDIEKPSFFYTLTATCKRCGKSVVYTIGLEWEGGKLSPQMPEGKPTQVFSREVTPYDLEAFAKMGWKGPLFCED